MDTGTTRKSHTRGKEWVWGVWPLRVCTGILLFLHAALMRIRVGGGGLLGGVLLGEALSGGFGGEYHQVLSFLLNLCSSRQMVAMVAIGAVTAVISVAISSFHHVCANECYTPCISTPNVLQSASISLSSADPVSCSSLPLIVNVRYPTIH